MTRLDKIFDRILGLIVLLAASMLTVPVALMLFTNQTRSVFVGAERVMPIFSVTATFLGYLIQAVFARMTGSVASRDGYSVEGKRTLLHFHVKYAAVPIALYLVIASALYFLSNAIFQILYSNGYMEYISVVYGLSVALIFLFSAMIGCVIWFYPIDRLTNVNVIIAAGVLFYAEMFFVTLIIAPLFSMGFSVLTHPTVSLTIVPPLVIFTICILVIFNQNNIQRKFRGSVVSVITPSARMYNLFLVFLLILVIILTSLLVYVVISGVALILYAIVFVFAYQIFYNKPVDEYSYHADYVDSDAVSKNFQRNVMSPENQYLLAMLFLLVLSAAALFFLAKTGRLQQTIAKLRTWFRDLLDSFLIGREIFKNADDHDSSTEIYNYKDEKKQLQNASIGDYRELADQTDTYRLFMLRLGRLKSYNEQLCYAYAVLLKMYKKININLKSSDTPREVESKVRRALTPEEIRKITDDFERIRYAEEEVPDAEATAILNNICAVIKRYMY